MNMKYRLFERTRMKLNREISSLSFLMQCKRTHVIPKFLKIHSKPINHCDRIIIEQSEIKRLRAHIRHKRGHIDLLNRQSYSIYQDLTSEVQGYRFTYRMNIVQSKLTKAQHNHVLQLNRKYIINGTGASTNGKLL